MKSLLIYLFALLALHPLATAAKDLADLPSLVEMEPAVEAAGKTGDTTALLKGLQSRNTFLGEMILIALKKYDLRIPIADVGAVMRLYAEPIDGLSDATSHEQVKGELVAYANRLTGKEYRYQPNLDAQPYLKLADDVERDARAEELLRTQNAPKPSASSPQTSGAELPPAQPVASSHRVTWLVVVAVAIVGLLVSWRFLKRGNFGEP